MWWWRSRKSLSTAIYWTRSSHLCLGYRDGFDVDVYRGSVPGENIQSRVLHLLVCVAVVAYVFDFSDLDLVEEFRFLAFVNHFFVNYGGAIFTLCGCG